MNSVHRRSRHQVLPVPRQSNNPYYEDNYHYYGNMSSHNAFDNAYQSHYHAPSSSYPQSFFPSHHPYTSRSRYDTESFPRKGSSSKKRSRHYNAMNQDNYKAGFNDRSNNLDGQKYQYQQSYHDEHLNNVSDSADDEEDEFLTPLEAEALRNAELNKTVHDTTTTTSTIPASTNTTTDTSAPLSNESSTTTPEQDQHHAAITSATTGEAFAKKKHDKALGIIFSFFQRLASTTPHQRKKKHSVKKSRQAKGQIQTMWVSTPLGDVMDQQQQQEVIQMLRQQTQTRHGVNTDDNRPTPHDDATKVASLDHIWVFRCNDTNINSNEHDATTSAIWTGFDYENQIRLSQHSDDENGIELYDTHIRNGLFPILVLKKRQVCFYAASTNNGTSDQVSSLQVACLPNSKNVQFVYRCVPPPLAHTDLAMY